MAIGHDRYSTAGSVTLENTQPLRVVYRNGPLALAHNGNLVNARALRQRREGSGSIFQTTLDTEIFLHVAFSSPPTPKKRWSGGPQVRGLFLVCSPPGCCAAGLAGSPLCWRARRGPSWRANLRS
jgi:predicted glutamine amidotransferase